MGRLATWPSRIFTLMASMKITAYTESNGLLCHSARPSMTRSVIAVIVCLDTSAPYTSARCAAISPCVSPFADREITSSPAPVSRRCLLATIFGSKLDSRSRGTEISTGPVSVITVLARCPLRELLPFQPAGAGPLGKLPQYLLIGRGQLRRLLVLTGRHVCHWCLLCLGSYTVEITVPDSGQRKPSRAGNGPSDRGERTWFFGACGAGRGCGQAVRGDCGAGWCRARGP